MTKSFMDRVNYLATRHNVSPAPATRKPRPNFDDGPWDWNGPEEGDKCDLSVWITHDLDEIIEITAGTVAKRKSIARRIVRLLNEGEARCSK